MNDFTYGELRALAEKLKERRAAVGHETFYAELAERPLPVEALEAIHYLGVLDAIACQKIAEKLFNQSEVSQPA